MTGAEASSQVSRQSEHGRCAAALGVITYVYPNGLARTITSVVRDAFVSSRVLSMSGIVSVLLWL